MTSLTQYMGPIYNLEPALKEAWGKAEASFKKDYKRSGYSFWCDIAAEKYAVMTANAREKEIALNEDDLVDLARLMMSETALSWHVNGKKKRQKR